MSREGFLLVFVLGAGVLALWVAVRLPALAPASLRSAGAHLAIAFAVGYLLEPALHAVPGLPAKLSLLLALFGIALPAITYMLVVGLWLVKLVVGQAPPARG